MATNKKPRRAYRPRPVTAHTLDVALHHAACPSAADRAVIADMLKDSVRAMRNGYGGLNDWAVIAGSLEVAQAIEKGGIVRGFAPDLAVLDRTVQRIYAHAIRAGAGKWASVELAPFDNANLNLLVTIYEFQISKLSRRELLAAFESSRRHAAAQGYTTTLASAVAQGAQGVEA